MNKNHPLVEELLKLRESSREAVADSYSKNDDPLKRHLHIRRTVEDDLVTIIRNTEDDFSRLILVCGNVGDGKSHTLSEVIKRDDLKNKIEQFKIHNDATESFSPDKDCLETLFDVLLPFSDSELNNNTSKLLIAINLGTLSNFLEQHGGMFTKLKEYVDNNAIIEDKEVVSSFEGTPFSHINFADYHLSQLNEKGIHPVVIEELLNKITSATSENPIYIAYQKTLMQDWGKDCLIKLNYDFLSKEINRLIIANLITQLAIEHKYIISIRQLLNFIFDILVPPAIANMSFTNYRKYIEKESLENKLLSYLPFHLFSNSDLSRIFSGLPSLDPCNERIEVLDEELVLLHTSNKRQGFYELLKEEFHANSEQIENISEANLSMFFIRYCFFNHNEIFTTNSLYREFLTALYWNNINAFRKQRQYHNYIKDAICRWNGNTNVVDKVMLRLDSPQTKYRVFKSHNINVIPSSDSDSEGELPLLDKFSLELKYRFENSKGCEDISIDFSLYTLLRRINKGYRPNKMDRNNYIQFSIFVDNLTLSESEDCNLFIDEVNIDDAIDFVLKLDPYKDITFEKVN